MYARLRRLRWRRRKRPRPKRPSCWRRLARGAGERGAGGAGRLRRAARRPGIGVAEAAQELRLAPNSVSTMVSQLAADGLLNRGRAEADGRSVRLTVTEGGAGA